MLDLIVVLTDEAYLREAVISSFLDGDLIQTEFLRSSIRCMVRYIPWSGPIDL
jgi:hypothetical protein